MIFDKIISTLHTIQSRLREKKKEKHRSPDWRKVRDEHLEKFSECAACGSKKDIQVHHIKPFHLHPELELNPKNLITLCMSSKWECHLTIGHGGSFKAYNPNVIEDAKKFCVSSATAREKLLTESKKNRLIY